MTETQPGTEMTMIGMRIRICNPRIKENRKEKLIFNNLTVHPNDEYRLGLLQSSSITESEMADSSAGPELKKDD